MLTFRNKLWSLLKRCKVSMGVSICVPETAQKPNSSTVRFSFTIISYSNSLPKGDAFSFHLQLNGGAFTHINHLTEEYNQTSERPTRLLFLKTRRSIKFILNSGAEGNKTKEMNYRKIPKISPGAYIFQRPFWGTYIRRGLSTEGNLRFKIDWASLIVGSKFTVLVLFYFVFEGNFPSTSPLGAYIWRGDLTEDFLRYRLGGLIFGGVYIWRGLFSEFYGIHPWISMRFPWYPISN